MHTSKFNECADLLRILAHPARLAILQALKNGKKCVNDVCELLKTPQPNVSQHLSVLRTVGIVTVTENGNWRCYSIANHELIRGILEILNAFCVKKHRDAKFTTG